MREDSPYGKIMSGAAARTGFLRKEACKKSINKKYRGIRKTTNIITYGGTYGDL